MSDDVWRIYRDFFSTRVPRPRPLEGEALRTIRPHRALEPGHVTYLFEECWRADLGGTLFVGGAAPARGAPRWRGLLGAELVQDRNGAACTVGFAPHLHRGENGTRSSGARLNIRRHVRQGGTSRGQRRGARGSDNVPRSSMRTAGQMVLPGRAAPTLGAREVPSYHPSRDLLPNPQSRRIEQNRRRWTADDGLVTRLFSPKHRGRIHNSTALLLALAGRRVIDERYKGGVRRRTISSRVCAVRR